MTNEYSDSTYLLNCCEKKYAKCPGQGSWLVTVNSEDNLYRQYCVRWNIMGKNKTEGS